ncbi:MAG: FHA domain-containing protein [Burkholderiaceae bacterium]|nr:MAG: FHA domain-containing protein [Burkholderiaceae bacterium]
MRYILTIEGPGFTQKGEVSPENSPFSIGRDPGNDLHLPDPEKSISRKHLVLRAGSLQEQGISIQVVSSVSGVITPKGEIPPGGELKLNAGDVFRLGAYSVRIDLATTARPAPSTHGDPFAALGLATPQGPSADPFHQLHTPRAAPASAGQDPFAALGLAPAAAPAPSSFSGLATPAPAPSLARTGAATPAPLAASSPGESASPLSSINDFLGVPAGSGTAQPGWRESSGSFSGLGGSGGSGFSSSPAPSFTDGAFLSAAPRSDAAPHGGFGLGGLAGDHVHDMNLPIQLHATAPAPSSPSAAPFSGGRIDIQMVAAMPPAMPPAMPQSPLATPPAPAFSPAPMPVHSDPFASAPGSDPFAGGDPFGQQDDPFGDDWSGLQTWMVGDEALKPRTPPPADLPLPLSGPAPSAVTVAPHEATERLSMPVDASGTSKSGTSRTRLSPEAHQALGEGLGFQLPSQMSTESWRQLGETVRLMAETFADLMASRAELKRELRADDRTMLNTRNNNPFKAGLEREALMQTLLLNAKGSGGYMSTAEALQESAAELRCHELAGVAAARASIEGTLQEFSPEKLKQRLDADKGRSMLKLMDHAKRWEAFEQDYEERSRHMADWLEQLFNRYYMPTYSKESARMKRQMQGDGPGMPAQAPASAADAIAQALAGAAQGASAPGAGMTPMPGMQAMPSIPGSRGR